MGISPETAAAKYEPLKPRFSSVDREAYITMSDGVRLAATLSFPSRDGKSPLGGRQPVILTMTPYGKDLDRLQGGPFFGPEYGFIRAYVDIRGTGASGGNLNDNYFSPREIRDGYEAVEYLAHQPWSNGRIGMRGLSYAGENQYLIAALQPPHLRAIQPSFALADVYRDAVYHGGIFSQFFGYQYLLLQQNGRGLVSGPLEQDNQGAALQAKIEHAQAESVVFDYFENTRDTRFYRERSPFRMASRIRVPAFINGGWYDGLIRGTGEMFRVLAKRDAETRLWIDPVPHSGTRGTGNPAGYSDELLDDLEAAQVEFYDRYLNGRATPRRRGVKLFIPGRERYIEDKVWPPRAVEYERLYLDKSGLAANPAPPTTESYRSNPTDGWTNALSRHGNLALTPYLPLDQSLERGAGLSWDTKPLTRATSLVGPMSMHLVASSSAPDTDWFVRVADVAPDGRAKLLSEGFLRASHRELDRTLSKPWLPYHTHTNPTPIPRATFIPYEIEVWPIGYEFKAGHRIRIQLTSDDSPNHFSGELRLQRTPFEVQLRPHEPALNTVRNGESSVLLPVFGDASGLGLGRRCLTRRSPIGPRNIGRIRLRYTRRRLLRVPMKPVRRTRRSYRYCVKGGSGRVTAVFSSHSRRGRVRLVTTTARGHGNRRVRVRSRAARFRSAYPNRRRIGRGLYRAGPRSPRVFGVRRGRVRFIAVADRRLLRNRRALRRYLRLAGVGADGSGFRRNRMGTSARIDGNPR